MIIITNYIYKMIIINQNLDIYINSLRAKHVQPAANLWAIRQHRPISGYFPSRGLNRALRDITIIPLLLIYVLSMSGGNHGFAIIMRMFFGSFHCGTHNIAMHFTTFA